MIALAFAAPVLHGCVTLSTPPAPGEGTVIVVTQVPANAGSETVRSGFSLDERYPPGSRIVATKFDAASAADARVLSRGFAAAGAPAPSPDLREVLFAGRRRPDSRWGIYQARLGGSKIRAIVELDRDCGDPVYLANDRLAFVCADDPGGAISRPTSSLYTASTKGAAVERITFGAGSALDPSALQDGRILFSMWQGPGAGRPDGGATSLFTVNPDGSMIEPFSGSHRAPAFKFRARPTADQGVVYLAADRPAGVVLVERVELARPQAPAQVLPLFLERGVVREALRPYSVQPLAGGGLLVSARLESAAVRATSAVYRAAPAGTDVSVVFDDPAWHEVEVVAMIPTPSPRGRPSALNPELQTGTLICYDVARTDGNVGPSPRAAHPTALSVEALTWPGGSEGAARRVVQLGEIPVQPDGSILLEVPADVPIRVRSIDADMREIKASEWFWLRPGEVRACFGCHENREAAPVNRYIQALDHPPARLRTLRAGLAP